MTELRILSEPSMSDEAFRQWMLARRNSRAIEDKMRKDLDTRLFADTFNNPLFNHLQRNSASKAQNT